MNCVAINSTPESPQRVVTSTVQNTSLRISRYTCFTFDRICSSDTLPDKGESLRLPKERGWTKLVLNEVRKKEKIEIPFLKFSRTLLRWSRAFDKCEFFVFLKTYILIPGRETFFYRNEHFENKFYTYSIIGYCFWLFRKNWVIVFAWSVKSNIHLELLL